MNPRIGCWIALLFSMGSLHAEINPKPGHTDPRIRKVVYNPDDVIRLIGYVGYQTHFKLGENERFMGVGAGDTWGLEITAHGNDTWVKPKGLLVRTNFDLKTNKRLYHFDYESRRDPPLKKSAMIYSITFQYPDDEAEHRRLLTTQQRLQNKLHAHGGTINRNYWYCGHESMKPVEAYDDGLQTHLRFSATAEFPAIFVENDDQTEALINFHMDPDDGEVVIHRIGHRFVLRRGDLVGCIENRQFTGGGRRMTNGTVSPDVVRETKVHDEAAIND